jgi:hypothetical protein
MVSHSSKFESFAITKEGWSALEDGTIDLCELNAAITVAAHSVGSISPARTSI